MPTNWKYIKKQLEKEFICQKLKGRISFDLTLYKPEPYEQQYFIIKYDDEILFEAKMRKYYSINQYTEYLNSEWIAHYNGIYGVEEIIKSIGVYLHSSVEDNLNSLDYFCRALAILDRRCGKRRLEELAKSDYIDNTPNWLKRIYTVRFKAENINYNSWFETQ